MPAATDITSGLGSARCGAQRQRHGTHLLRLHREHHDLGAARRAGVVRRALDAVVADQALQLLGARIGDRDALARKPAPGQAADQGGGHVAAADECKST